MQSAQTRRGQNHTAAPSLKERGDMTAALKELQAANATSAQLLQVFLKVLQIHKKHLLTDLLPVANQMLGAETAHLESYMEAAVHEDGILSDTIADLQRLLERCRHRLSSDGQIL